MRDLLPADLLTTGLLGGILAAAALLSGLLSAVLIRLFRPLLVRYALARPNARSSHSAPTPQGGGAAVVAAALAAGAATTFLLAGRQGFPVFAVLAAATLALAALGAVDDIRPLPAGPRLLVQLAAVALVVWAADPGRLLPEAVPLWLERGLLVLGGAWWVNLVNFMDGIDWITVAEFVPLTGALVLFGLWGALPLHEAALAAALGGALLGFAPANRPVARLFLGDVGSLPTGLLTGAMLLGLAGAGHIAAALLLPLYYLADATLTLGLRLCRGERVWEAHRSHFYHRALGNGLSVLSIDAHLLALNLGLAALAAATIRWPAASLPAIGVGAILVVAVLRRFAKPRPDSGDVVARPSPSRDRA